MHLGVSPRGALALTQACQAAAVVAGRDYVTPDDVKTLFIPCCAHRVVSKTYLHNGDVAATSRVLQTILERIPVAAMNMRREDVFCRSEMSRITSANLIERFGPRGTAAWRWLTSRTQKSAVRDEGPATPVRRRPSVDFSLTGLIYCAMMLFMGLAAINSQANLLFGVFGLMIGILLISALICRLVLAGLRVKRIIPEYAAVGQNATIQYDFFNSKKFWPSLSVGLAELDGAEAFTQQPQAYMLHAAAGPVGQHADQRCPQTTRPAQADQFPDQHQLPVRLRQTGIDGPLGRHNPDLSRPRSRQPATALHVPLRRTRRREHETPPQRRR